MIKTSQKFEEDIKTAIEDTFDTCSTNREEIYWLICILRGFMNIKNKRKEAVVDNYRINLWQYQLFPIIESIKRRYNCSTFFQNKIFKEDDFGFSTNKDKHWYNNGVEQVFTQVCPVGFKPGMLTKTSKKKR
jgi:hypothetical protein